MIPLPDKTLGTMIDRAEKDIKSRLSGLNDEMRYRGVKVTGVTMSFDNPNSVWIEIGHIGQ